MPHWSRAQNFSCTNTFLQYFYYSKIHLSLQSHFIIHSFERYFNANLSYFQENFPKRIFQHFSCSPEKLSTSPGRMKPHFVPIWITSPTSTYPHLRWALCHHPIPCPACHRNRWSWPPYGSFQKWGSTLSWRRTAGCKQQAKCGYTDDAVSCFFVPPSSFVGISLPISFGILI